MEMKKIDVRSKLCNYKAISMGNPCQFKIYLDNLIEERKSEYIGYREYYFNFINAHKFDINHFSQALNRVCIRLDKETCFENFEPIIEKSGLEYINSLIKLGYCSFEIGHKELYGLGVLFPIDQPIGTYFVTIIPNGSKVYLIISATGDSDISSLKLSYVFTIDMEKSMLENINMEVNSGAVKKVNFDKLTEMDEDEIPVDTYYTADFECDKEFLRGGYTNLLTFIYHLSKCRYYNNKLGLSLMTIPMRQRQSFFKNSVTRLYTGGMNRIDYFTYIIIKDNTIYPFEEYKEKYLSNMSN